MSSPTALTLRRLRNAGYTAGVVEHWIPKANKRRDLFGFADVAAVRADRPGTLYVQTTTAGHMSHRLRKLRTCLAMRTVLLAGNRVVIDGWRKVGGSWIVKVREMRLRDLEGAKHVQASNR